MLKERKEWNIRDSSKLTDYITCPRMYFYTHILGWRLDKPNHDLHFGECWHRAREHQLLHGYDDIQGAYNAFITHYRTEFDVETDEMFLPKDPANVLHALMKFADERSNDLLDNELLYTEISGTVPIAENRFLHYRMDSVLRNKENNKIFSWDHKSTKKAFWSTWADQFHLGIQNGTYTHCLYCMYPAEKVIGIEFCGTCFVHLKRKSKLRDAGYHVEFQRVPAFRSQDQMNVWLWTVNSICDDLDKDMERLSYCTKNDKVLMAFPMNPTNCTKYRGCVFHDYCLSLGNPLQRCDEPPLGFKVEFWDPSSIETTNKKDLEWG